MNRETRRAVRRLEVRPITPLLLVFPELGEVELRFDMEALACLMTERPDVLQAAAEVREKGADESVASGRLLAPLIYYGCRAQRPDLTEEELMHNIPPDPALLMAIVESISDAMPTKDPTKANPKTTRPTKPVRPK